MKRPTNSIGKPGKQLLMTAMLTIGLTWAVQAEAHPVAPPPVVYRQPVQKVIITTTPRYDYRPIPPHRHPPPMIYRQPVRQVVITTTPRYDYRPAPPPQKRSWFFRPWR